MQVHIFALAAHGEGISGGDRIFIELSRRFKDTVQITIYVWEEGRELCRRQNLTKRNVRYRISKLNNWKRFGFVVLYLVRIMEGVRLGVTLKLKNEKEVIVYSASDFWMDALPCILLKLRYPKIRWLAGWFQTAPNPFKGFSGGRYKKSALFYYLSQLPVKPLVGRFANFVFINNESEKSVFPKLVRNGKVFVLIGAVNLALVKAQRKVLPKIFDAVFQGRFHPQKGVVELIEIWKLVTKKFPKAKLAMIGDGPLMPEVKAKVVSNNLQKNIQLLGFMFDGKEKYRLFSQSKLVVHPAFYDSGGMASAEAMAFGIPCVGFDLPAYKSYYPKGMVKVPLGSTRLFAKSVVKLLDDKKLRNKIGKDAKDMIFKNYSWDTRARQVFNFINEK